MDDMRNTSAPLYGKAEPATTKTTMSVREMRQLLGLGKTDSYWLLHKNLFEVILINDKRRIVISSFEKWYANQVKYHKVNGSPPGEELCKRSYSVPDAAEILKVKPETIYTLIRQGKLKTETADFCMRIPKEDFERWYRSQSRYRTAADRERDREIEAQTISIPEMAKLLGIPREKVYWILDCKKYRDCFVIERVADRRRITKTSFEIWLNSQSTYRLQEPVMEAHEEPPLELKWKKQMGTFNLSANTALIANYIAPLIGSMKLQDISTRVIEGYYQRLLKYEAADPMCGKRKHQFVSPGTVRSVHKILRSAFEQAVKWELMEKNPCIYATLPKYTSKKRDIWTAETLFRALKVCDDPKLRLCINLSFSCSLRLGELLGLTWDCVDISPESIEAGRASIYINKELQRVDVASLNALENKNVITRFPSLSSRCTTVQVLKSPKTDSSIRTIFLPKTVAEMLVEFKAEQDMTKEALGAEYTDYNLVVAGPLGMPTEQSTINGALKKLIEKNDLPKVVFHSFRHSSITYKLKLNGGDIKAVQGDSGHAQASMVTEQYAHILDDDRRLNAQRFDDFFYQHQGAEPEMPPQTAQPIPENSAVDADAAAALTKLLANPSMAELIKNLAKNL